MIVLSDVTTTLSSPIFPERRTFVLTFREVLVLVSACMFRDIRVSYIVVDMYIMRQWLGSVTMCARMSAYMEE